MDEPNKPAQAAKYTCPYCHLEFLREGSLFSHIDSLHEKDSAPDHYECSLCGYQTKKIAQFRKHTATHTDAAAAASDGITSRFFVCPVCQMTFKKRHRLREHQSKEHENRKPYSCDKCGQDFAALSNYTKHVCFRASNDVKCLFCDEKFKSRKDMLLHSKQAHEKPHVCPTCGNAFRRKENLQQHLETHSADRAARRRFVCSVEGCKSSFTRKSNLKTHMQTIHGGVLPFSCDTCGKTFRYPSLLAKHRELHKKEPEPEIIEIDLSLL